MITSKLVQVCNLIFHKLFQNGIEYANNLIYTKRGQSAFKKMLGLIGFQKRNQNTRTLYVLSNLKIVTSPNRNYFTGQKGGN